VRRPVAADPGAERHAFAQFMAPTLGTPPPSPSTTGGGGGRASKPGPVPDLTADVSEGKAQRAALGSVGIPVYFPRVISAGSYYCSGATGNCPAQVQTTGAYPRAYAIQDQNGHYRPAYRMTLVLNPILGQYYGVQGTAWQHPPILNSPTETRTVDGKQLEIYVNGGKVSLVAWHTPQAVYWISNTLTDAIGNRQMIAIAGSLTQ
jgi:hypothetical protein